MRQYPPRSHLGDLPTTSQSFHVGFQRNLRGSTPSGTVFPANKLLNTITGPLTTFIDEAYSGVYVYAPEEFMTGNEFRFVVYDARLPSRAHHSESFKADSKLIRGIRSDFREALEGADYWETDYLTASVAGTGTLVVTGEEIGVFVIDGRTGGIDLLEVLVGSPAYEAGLRTGDKILLIDGNQAIKYKDFSDLLKRVRQGKLLNADLEVRRQTRKLTVQVKGQAN